MSQPNFSQIDQITTALEEINNFEKELSQVQKELESAKLHYQSLENQEKIKLESQIKQRILLDAIEKELEDLRKNESTLRLAVQAKIDDAISQYFAKGEFKNFVTNLLNSLRSKGTDFTIKINKDYSTYLPEGQAYEEVVHPEAFRIDLGYKSYIMDIDKLKSELRDNILKQEISKLKN
jgi:aspartyl/asparaginyl-tRNA synthetase